MAETTVPHKDKKDELWWNEDTVFKQRSLFRSCPWVDKADVMNANVNVYI